MAKVYVIHDKGAPKRLKKHKNWKRIALVLMGALILESAYIIHTLGVF